MRLAKNKIEAAIVLKKEIRKRAKRIFECGYWKGLGKKTKIWRKQVEESRGNTEQEIQTNIRKICEMIRSCQ